MQNLSIKAVVEGDGYYYREEHEWRGMNPTFSTWMEQKLDAANKFLADPKNATGTLTATLSAVIDGQALPDAKYPKMSHKAVAAMEAMWTDWSYELVGHAKALAHGKDQRK